MVRALGRFLVVLMFLLVASSIGYVMSVDSDSRKADVTGQRVDMDVKLSREGDYTLVIKLANRSRAALSVYEHSLPWEGWNSILLVAVQTDAVGTPLEAVRPVDIPGPTVTTLQPEKALEGKISLTKRFPGLTEALQKRDVIVFWSYQLQPLKGSALERSGGWLLIPKAATK